MGIEASKPNPGTKLQVIGAGLPRTGTASFSLALSILLNGPVYHGGTQTLKSSHDNDIKTWTDLLAHTPYKTPSDREYVISKLRELTQGYVAVTDAPCAQFVEELLEIYPDAKVICTVRDADAWAQSMDATSKSSLQTFLPFMIYLVPVVRYFPSYITALQKGRWEELYSKDGEKWSYGQDVWERHLGYLDRVVGKDKVVFFDVREGWVPLCQALRKDVPVDQEFPRINDGNAIERFAGEQLRRGLVRWAVVVGIFAVSAAVGWRLY
ncbi:hypothetical protein HII31_09633 [Pseudocercospora fuligena]|uniref:NAD dependent epimerase/dehydratase n=1 Tax=Pseudocercospora fuligena TaxID=685502 RepID=A0A8H6VF21_9PEZI|nr:hypothetical protein HII31_09633 [Pseudocercospora fuligena]